MKKYLILLPLFFIGCTISQKIVYKTDDISSPLTVKPIQAMVELRVLEDNRIRFKENSLLFTSSNSVDIGGKQTCINSEKHYKRDTVVNMITNIMVDHFNKARLFKMSYYNKSKFCDYYLSGKLNTFYAEQEFSPSAAVGAQFGLIGALATAGIKTPGKIIIEMTDLKLFKKDGTLIKDFGTLHKEYKDDFKTDPYCFCAFFNINDKLKDFNSDLVEKIRADMEGVQL